MLLVMGRHLAGKHSHFLSVGLVMMESSQQLKNLCVTYIAHRNSKPPTMPDYSCLVRPKRVWRCCLQLMMPWNFMQYVPTTRQRCGCKQTKHINILPLPLSPIPDACIELVTCICKSKRKIFRCSCFKKKMQCTAVCGSDVFGCCNLA